MYDYEAQGWRNRAKQADDSFWVYSYNGRNEVTGGSKRWGNNSVEGIMASGMQYGYTFDPIGNRTQTATNGRTAAWEPNSLNQLTGVNHAGTPALDVLGEADPASTVKVNTTTATRFGAALLRTFLTS